MNQLEPCPTCHRHVRIDETACPFCAGALDFSEVVPRVSPRVRLGRAATFAFGMVTSACGSDAPKPDAHPADAHVVDAPRDAAGPDAYFDPDGGGVAIYCAAPTPDGGTTDRKS
jgi:hypothetical protein